MFSTVVLCIYIGGYMSSALPQTGRLQALPGSVEQLRGFASGGFLFAVMDGCYSPEVIARIQAVAPEHIIPLLKNRDADAGMAPHLIEVNPPILDFMVSAVGPGPWGVFAMSKAGLETLRIHFRRFLVVEVPGGEQWYFRYYDPRLLPIYLANCEEWELRKFFGLVRGFGIPIMQENKFVIVQGPPALDTSDPRSDTDPYVSLVWRIRPEQVMALNQVHSKEL